jgi:hypothetical protein
MRVLERRPGFDARTFAEAQSLIDEGLDRDLVLELYPAEAPWLAPLLLTSERIASAARTDEPSWYFEASLKQRFIEAGARRARHGAPAIAPATAGGWSRMRAGIAGAGIAAGAAVTGVAALGFLTADDADPGDWNYAFKLGTERIDYGLSEGDSRVSVQLRQTGERVQEIAKRSDAGSVTEDDLTRLMEEAERLTRLAQERPLDEAQKDRLIEIGDTANKVLNDVGEKRPELQPQAKRTKEVVQDAVVAGLGGPISGLASPTATASPSPAATESPTPSPTASPTETPSPSPTGTSTPTPTAPVTPTATADTSETPTPTEAPSPTTEETQTPATPEPTATVEGSPAPPEPTATAEAP